MKPWAQEERKAWVRASQRVKVLKGVREEGGLCAELFRSPHENKHKDWIERG